MEILFKNRKLNSTLSDAKKCLRKHGAEMTKKIRLRLAALQAAESLADLWPPMTGPERCHALKADRAGQFTVDLKHPYRLVFEPYELDEDENFASEIARWQAIQSVVILGIVDTHE